MLRALTVAVLQEAEALDGSAVKVDRKTVVRLLQRGAEAGALAVHSVQLQPRSGVPARDFEIVTLPGGLTADTVSKVPCRSCASVRTSFWLPLDRSEFTGGRTRSVHFFTSKHYWAEMV